MLKSQDLIKKKIERAKAYVHYDYKKLWLCQESFTMRCHISHRKCVNIIIFLNDMCPCFVQQNFPQECGSYNKSSRTNFYETFQSCLVF